MRVRISTAVAVVVALTVAAVLTRGWRGPTEHDESTGLLSVSGGGGSYVVQRVDDSAPRISAIFATFVTCTTHGEPIEIQDVAWSAHGQDVAVTPLLRRVPTGSLRDSELEYEPLVDRGTPSSIRPKLGGRFVPPAGQRVSGRACGDPPKADSARDDFVMVVTAGRGGAKVDDIVIEYTAGSRRYALDVGYTLVLCGTAVSDPDCGSS